MNVLSRLLKRIQSNVDDRNSCSDVSDQHIEWDLRGPRVVADSVQLQLHEVPRWALRELRQDCRKRVANIVGVVLSGHGKTLLVAVSA